MRYLIAGVMLILAGCASLNSDLQTARAKCDPAAAMTVFVTCLNAVEEPVWRRYSPENVPGFRTFAAVRMVLAQDLDSGKITAAQFRDAAAQAHAKFNALLAQNASARQMQEDQRMLDSMQDLRKPPSPTGMGMGDGMGGM